jgi:alpha-tubulin suppressor-like RCC1 family protein
VTALAAGGRHTCALIETGALKCWGQNQRGQLGDGTTADRVVPVNVAELSTGVMALAAGWQHSCALMLNGSIKCWGNNGNGQLGIGNLLLKVTATDVAWIPTAAVAVAAGREHTCALLADNAVRCWGDDEQGQLGKDTKVSRRLF